MKRSTLCILFFAFSLVASQPYDVIFAGMGTASSITLTKLVQAFPDKSFLAIELGGPTSVYDGGSKYPPYFTNTPSTNKATIADVPGEYANIAFQSQGEPYKITQIPFTWQGMGFGGNSQWNGMLYQEAPNYYLDALPSGWRSGDLRPYFNEIRSKMTITNTPSKDGKTYLGGIHDVLSALYQLVGWFQADTSNLGTLNNPGYYSRPYVATNGNGQRGGPVSGYLTNIIATTGASKVSNLQVVPFAEVNKILFSATDPTTATGVVYTKTGTNTPVTVNLKAGGRVIVGAGSLMTPRLLYLSGVGPSGKEATVLDNPQVTFTRNNPKVGANVYDHVGTQVAIDYQGTKPVQTIRYGDYNANSAALNQYVNSRSGPYAQYGPVSISHGQSDPNQAHPNFELFTNPSGPGGGDDRVNTATSFQIVSMLYRTRSTDVLGLDFQQNVRFPNIYFSNDQDAVDQTNAIQIAINKVLSKDANVKLTLGPGSATNPNLDPQNFNDVKSYVTSGNGYSGVQGSGLIMNHYTGTVPLISGSESAGGVDPTNLRVRATSNVHVVDASVLPGAIPCHPVATVMAIGAKAADVIAATIRSSSPSTTTRTSTIATSAPATSTTRVATSSTAVRTSTTTTVKPTTTTQVTPATSSSGPVRCGAGYCGGSDQCCNGQCYSPSVYTCAIDNKGATVLCPKGTGACNGGCYQTDLYICTSSGLQPK